MREYDSLDFCLQSHNGGVIATLLINNVPLYDNIICKHAKLSFDTNDEERRKFIFQSYDYDVDSVESLSEEFLFYYNFPENLMPVDPKHNMVGFTPGTTFFILFYPFLNSNESHIQELKYDDLENDIKEYQWEDNGIICLVHTCDAIGCSNFQMDITRNCEDETIVLHSFKDSFGNLYHPEIKFVIKEENYLEVLKSLKKVCDESKGYEDYLKFETDRFYREND